MDQRTSHFFKRVIPIAGKILPASFVRTKLAGVQLTYVARSTQLNELTQFSKLKAFVSLTKALRLAHNDAAFLIAQCPRARFGVLPAIAQGTNHSLGINMSF